MLPISLKTPQEVRQEIADRFKARRLGMNLTQRELAERSGVTWSSLKRFEREGLIALDSLLNLAWVLDCIADFDQLAVDVRPPVGQSLDAFLAAPPPRRRATGRKGRNHAL